jgi:hypothetical protein
MALKQKIILLCVVSFGILIIIAACVRLDRIVKLNESSDTACKTSPASPPVFTPLIIGTGDASDVTTWTSLEVSVGLFCASAPCIRPLIRQIAPDFLASVSRTFSGSSRQRGTKYGTSKANGYAKGAATFGSRRGGRGEAFELQSADEGEFGKEAQPREGNSFWIRTDSDVLSQQSGHIGGSKTDGKSLKTVRVSVQEGVRSVEDEGERSRMESIMVKLDV